MFPEKISYWTFQDLLPLSMSEQTTKSLYYALYSVGSEVTQTCVHVWMMLGVRKVWHIKNVVWKCVQQRPREKKTL